MNLWRVLSSAAVGVFENVVPGGAAIVDVVNELLPDDKKLKQGATTQDVQNAVESIPPEQRAALLMREFDVKLEDLQQRGQTQRSMLEAEMQSKRSTRPFIAKWSFVFTALFSGIVGFAIAAAYGWAVYKQDQELVKAVVDGWTFVAALLLVVTGPFTILLKAYFGILCKEQEQKLGAASGVFKPSTLASVIGAMRK